MNDKGKVWVLASAVDELDRHLVEALGTELDEKVEVELHAPAGSAEEHEGVTERLWKLMSDPSERSWDELPRELAEAKPNVVLSAQPHDIRLLAEIARRGGPRPVRIGVVREPVVGPEWLKSPADLLVVADEHAAESAKSRSSCLRVTGVPVGRDFVPDPDAVADREGHRLEPDAHVLFIPSGTVEPEQRTQLLIQLGLVRLKLEVIFEVADAAEADDLRQMVPAHGIAASIAPAGEAGAPFWALAHLIFARAQPRELFRSRAVAAPMLAAPPSDDAERRRAAGLVSSGAGRRATSLATLAVDIDLSFEPERYEGLVERQRALRADHPEARVAEVVLEGLTKGPALAASSAGLPQGLERLSLARGREAERPTDRIEEAVKAATEVRDRGEFWSQRARLARSRGEDDLAIEADKRAAHHRQVLDRLLGELRERETGEPDKEADLDDELDSLRRKVAASHNVEERLRALDVEDELRELKERLEQE